MHSIFTSFTLPPHLHLLILPPHLHLLILPPHLHLPHPPTSFHLLILPPHLHLPHPPTSFSPPHPPISSSPPSPSHLIFTSLTPPPHLHLLTLPPHLHLLYFYLPISLPPPHLLPHVPVTQDQAALKQPSEAVGVAVEGSTPVSFRLVIQTSQCGSLIGKGGSKIKEIREVHTHTPHTVGLARSRRSERYTHTHHTLLG